MVGESLKREPESLESVGSLENSVAEGLASGSPVLMVVGLLVLKLSQVSTHSSLGFQGTVNQHRSDVDHVVTETVGLQVSLFLVIVHLDTASTHLDHPVVDCLVGPEGSLQESVLKSQHTPTCLDVLIPGAHINQHSNIHH